MFSIRKAERRQAKLRLALTGISGSGKTLGALLIASGMDGKFALIDTEHKSADLHAGKDGVKPFDIIDLDKPFTPEKYIQAIHYCEDQGYDIIIIDSLSHAWAGEGGALDMHDNFTQASSSKNSYMAWKEVTPWQNRLVNSIIQSPAHIIATMRVKTHHDFVDVGGKKKPVKIGLAPVQREGLDYEFTTVLSLEKDSFLYTSSKDRTDLFEGKHEKLSNKTGKMLMEWLMSGKSNSEIEEEEVSQIKDKLAKAETVESLRELYRQARNKFPKMSEDFLSISTQRNSELTITSTEVH